jgi:hypothetical protein
MNNLLSFSSLKLDVFSKNNVLLKTASGFVVEAARRYYLITNRHVVCSGAIPDRSQQETGTVPYALKTSIHIHAGQGEKMAPLQVGMRKRLTVPLYDDKDAPSWIESRVAQQGQPIVDIIAAPIQYDLTLELLSANNPGVYIDKSSWSKISNYWMKISAIPFSAIDADVEYGPPDIVHVIGYPLGWAPAGPDRSSSAFWRTSFIASEIYEAGRTRSDAFFVDPCAPQGMTGSPVVGLKSDRLRLLGVYSDQSTAEFGASAGYVWGAWLLKELIPQRRAG